jgi:arsenate reductase
LSSDRSTILFLCTHNSARSQLAEALMRHHFGDRFDVRSAGTEATRVKPEVLIVLAEAGVSADGLSSKTIDGLGDWEADFVVTVCDDAREHCPYQPGRKATIHKGFLDPSRVTSSTEERVEAFRQARDEIAAWLLDQFSH